MPRRSESSRVVGAIAGEPPATMPVAPDWLEAAAVVVWQETLADVPAGHLRAADLQLLPTFCRLVVYERQLWATKAKLGGDAAQLTPEELGQVLSDLTKEIRETAKTIYMLGTKMRLVASANSRIETGSNKRGMLDRKARPWLAG